MQHISRALFGKSLPHLWLRFLGSDYQGTGPDSGKRTSQSSLERMDFYGSGSGGLDVFPIVFGSWCCEMLDWFSSASMYRHSTFGNTEFCPVCWCCIFRVALHSDVRALSSVGYLPTLVGCQPKENCSFSSMGSHHFFYWVVFMFLLCGLPFCSDLSQSRGRGGTGYTKVAGSIGLL